MTLKDRFNLVIFDWAGTMVDFGCIAPVIALREAFAQHGIALSEVQARRDMGIAKIDHVRALLREPVIARAWFDTRGRAPAAVDVDALMNALEPLMREQAARAAHLIEGARVTVEALRALDIKVGSSTGYTRDMMEPVLLAAAAQGYSPDHVVCAGETPAGRPTPLMIYKACAELGVWPLSRVVKVDDSESGIAEGRAAGCFTVGVAASGNCMGLTPEALRALPTRARDDRLKIAERALCAAGADIVIESVADLMPTLAEAFKAARE